MSEKTDEEIIQEVVEENEEGLKRLAEEEDAENRRNPKIERLKGFWKKLVSKSGESSRVEI